MRTAMMARLVLGSLMLGSALALGACAATPKGLEFGMGIGSLNVVNQTDKIVKVELITVDKFGTPKVYSTSTLTIGATFHHGTDRDNRFRQMRAKFIIADEPGGGDVNFVQLNVPEGRGRDYDLKLTNGRLTAREVAKGRRPE